MLVMEVDEEDWDLGYDAVDGGSTASVAAILDGKTLVYAAVREARALTPTPTLTPHPNPHNPNPNPNQVGDGQRLRTRLLAVLCRSLLPHQKGEGYA